MNLAEPDPAYDPGRNAPQRGELSHRSSKLINPIPVVIGA